MDSQKSPSPWARWALCNRLSGHVSGLAPARTTFIFIVIGTFMAISVGSGPLWAAPPSSPKKQKQEPKKASAPQKDKSQGKSPLVPQKGDNKQSSNKGGQGQKDLSYGYDPPKVDKEQPSATWLLLKTLAILVVFIGGFYVIFRFLTKRGRSQMLGSEMVQVLANVPIANQRFLQIVDIAGGVYVLGVTEQSISLITRVQDPQLLQQIKVQSSRIQQQQQNLHFSEWLQRALGSAGTTSAQKSNQERSNLVSEFVTRHRQKMSELKKQAGGSPNEL